MKPQNTNGRQPAKTDAQNCSSLICCKDQCSDFPESGTDADGEKLPRGAASPSRPRNKHAPSLICKTAQQLLEEPREERRWVVDRLLSGGVALLVADPKTGKSLFSLAMGKAVSEGQTFLGLETTKCQVLYLSLEDCFDRIQDRLFDLTDEATDDLFISVRAKTLGTGLLDELDEFVKEHPNVGLIIIDTFQKVREGRGNTETLYSADYADVGKIKDFADDRKLAVVLIHHTRKMQDPSNPFARISGSNGLMGAADTTIMLTQQNKFAGDTVLHATGRDIAPLEMKLRRKGVRWECLGITSEEELVARAVPQCVHRVIGFMAARNEDWKGNATTLIEVAGIEDASERVINKKLNEHCGFLRRNGVEYGSSRCSNSRRITLKKVEPESKGNDSSGAKEDS
ncbi:MAG: AAA family ATPase [Eggerthellaceae bacterium]|nr:AAA family ATPase [Eggerthellaceae bacterium]